jgi:Uma2 family endonuclease
MAAEIYVTILTGFGLGHLLHYDRELNAMDQGYRRHACHRRHRSARRQDCIRAVGVLSSSAMGHGTSLCVLSFLGYLSPMPITIELPDLASQTRFNLDRWTEILADPELARLPNRIETDRLGRILMSPPPAFRHSRRQFSIGSLLSKLLPQGLVLTECPVSTADGVKAVDVVWLASNRPEIAQEPLLLTRSPEICIEILSPSNSPSEIDEKRALYFDAGATEVWICALDGSISFFSPPHQQVPSSSICPDFPAHIP